MGILKAYERLMQNHPALAPIAIGALLGALSDVTAQLIVGDPYDATRTLRYFINALVIMMPITKIWLTILMKVVPPETPNRGIKMLLVDQLIGAPIITFIIFGAMGLMRFESLAVIGQSLSQHYFTALLNGYMVWPLAQLINFMLVPDQYRMLFMNLVGFGFGIIMAMTLEPRKGAAKEEL